MYYRFFISKNFLHCLGLLLMFFTVNAKAETDNTHSLTDIELASCVDSMARGLLRQGFNAGSGYSQVWIRDLNTFIETAAECVPAAELRGALYLFFALQQDNGEMIDGCVLRKDFTWGDTHPYYSSLAPDHVAFKNTVETDQETSLIQSVRKYVECTGDISFLSERIGDKSVWERMVHMLEYLLRERWSDKYGLIYGATTADWGDVQPNDDNVVDITDSTAFAIDVYDNAMLLIALDDMQWLRSKSKTNLETATDLSALHDTVAANVRRYLWDAARSQFRPHVYLGKNPLPEGFDEAQVYYHGGTAVAIEAGLLSYTEIAHALARMRENVRASGMPTIGLTLYPPYPDGWFRGGMSKPYIYQNGGDWTWFGGRMIQQLARWGFADEARVELRPMLERVIANNGFHEWYGMGNRPSGSGNFKGSAGVLSKAIAMLYGRHDSGSVASYKIWFDEPARETVTDSFIDNDIDKDWERGSLPIGNGSIGANVMGSVGTERITLNEKTLWRGGPNTSRGAEYYWDVNKASAGVLPAIRKAFAEGNQELASRLTRDHFNGKAAYEPEDEKPFRFGSFTTLGELLLSTGLNPTDISNYQRTLSLDSAVAKVCFRHCGARYERDFFVSYPDSVFVMRLSADKPGLQSFVMYYVPNAESSGSIVRDGDDALLYKGSLDSNGMAFCVRIRVSCHGGTCHITDDGRLVVDAADEVVLLLTADTDYSPNFDPDFNDPYAFVGKDPFNTTRMMMEAVINKSYDSLLRSHVADYQQLFNRVSLCLTDMPNSSAEHLPTNLRLQRYRNGMADRQLEETYFQFGRYLLIACSRPGNMPANLQGIWSRGVDGPWRVDYHNNINVQMNYWPACAANLSECSKPLVDYIRTLVKPGRVTAQSYFGARGWTAGISGNIFGFTAPLSSKDMSWNLNPMAGPWLCTHIWDYYDYTRDKDFLRHVGYQLIADGADFAVDCLWHRPDGSYTAAPSTSPEHGPIDQGATYAHAVAREILTDAISASKVLGCDSKRRRQWQDVLDHIVPYQTGRYGQLIEWSQDIDDPDDRHRHVNHLFGLHPGHTISPVTTPELANASRIVLEHRGDGATGWSMGWKLCMWARLHDGNHAYRLLHNLLCDGTSDNLWCLHPPFQIDGNFGGAAGMTEMLMQSHMGFIHLLPALPDAWSAGRVTGLLAHGNFEVSVYWSDGKLERAVIVSKSGGPCKLRYGNKTLSIKTKKNQQYVITRDWRCQSATVANLHQLR